MPPIYNPHAALQTFKYCTDEEIERDLSKRERDELTKNGTIPLDISKVDWAMNWHSEYGDGSTVPPFNRSLSLYLNDDFMFYNKVKPYFFIKENGTPYSLHEVHKTLKNIGPYINKIKIDKPYNKNE
jgi:hypothetical protein